ncbi:hypothetical protein TR13x_10765 [Caloranaerobacter sp. TR13]|uniref:2'-5' RNA ligase family protein n=1 Tax=Caloranaerobacter sp. TR13 TaxID=1302151 RepID=UPI0006D402B6|nr:2'-5' RNA ligase family protein [Caloranaerobacter sp. TR13]KPU26288.1 hypothetical protein TR13x_10765 [Caloranaerobacter sp. TR13]
MPYAIELYVDTESSKTIDEICNKLASEGISIDKGTKPHISLAIYEDIPIESFKKELQMFSYKTKPFDITLSSVGMFVTESIVIYLAPTVTKELLGIHSEFHNSFKKYRSKAWDYYLPNRWVPHCTLAMNLNDEMVNKTINICRGLELPINVKINKSGILEFKPNKQLIEYKLG